MRFFESGITNHYPTKVASGTDNFLEWSGVWVTTSTAIRSLWNNGYARRDYPNHFYPGLLNALGMLHVRSAKRTHRR